MSYAKALHECGLHTTGPGYEVAVTELFKDWAGVVRKLGKLPTIAEYEMHDTYSLRPPMRHYAGWAQCRPGS